MNSVQLKKAVQTPLLALVAQKEKNPKQDVLISYLAYPTSARSLQSTACSVCKSSNRQVVYSCSTVNINWKKLLTKNEYQLFERLNTPKKIQDYLESLPINFEKKGETCLSPRLVIKKRKAHCIEGAMFAAAVLWFHGQKPLLLDLTTIDKDYDHVVALFLQNGHWGAISKTNHAVLRYREPVYKTVRELAMSYFHEYFWKDGIKTMRSFSKPFDLRKYGANWIVNEKSSWVIPDDLDASSHYKILTSAMIRSLRKADKVEIEAGEITQWKK